MIWDLIWIFVGYIVTTVTVGWTCWVMGFMRGKTKQLKEDNQKLERALKIVGAGNSGVMARGLYPYEGNVIWPTK
jgi:hypothetical protein